MKILVSKLAVTAAIALLTISAANAAAPVQISFFDLKAPRDADVSGVRFPAIYGKGGGDIKGLDLQLLAYSEMKSLKGVSFPLLIGGANHITGEMVGASFGWFNWHEGQDTGANIAWVNVTNNVKGANVGAVNFSKGHTMIDVGWVNVSQKSNFQLSFVNVTKEIDGVQIGLLNCAKNGFLPCFIFFNFAKN
jgi:hypothetical protein